MKIANRSIQYRNGNRSWATSVGLFALALFYFYELIPYQYTLRDYSFDLYQVFSPRQQISSPVTIVTIDEESLEQFGQWPWPRSLTAEVITKINEFNPAAVGINILMPESDRSDPCRLVSNYATVSDQLRAEVCELPDPDTTLAQVLFETRAVLGAAGIQNAEGSAGSVITDFQIDGPDPKGWIKNHTSAIHSIPLIEFSARGVGLIDTDIEDGVMRKTSLFSAVSGQLMPSFASEMLRVALGVRDYGVETSERGVESISIGDIRIPTNPDGSLSIYYSASNTERYVPVIDLLEGRVNPEKLERRLVILDVTGAGLAEFPLTVLGERVPGSEVYAQAIENIFDQTLLTRPSWALAFESALIFFLGLIVIHLLPRLRAVLEAPALVILIIAMAYAGVQLFRQKLLLIDFATPALAFVGLYLLMLIDSFVYQEAQVQLLEKDLQKQREAAARTAGEMEAARRFQLSIVPDSKVVFEQDKRIDLAALMEPARDVGGDLYDFFYLDDKRIFFCVGDVCGKGVPASLFMVITKTLLKSIVLRIRDGQTDLGQIVTQANTEIARDNPEMLFVTLFAGILDLDTGELLFCNAGHDQPIEIDLGGNPTHLEAKSGPPVGALDEFEYRYFRHQLKPGAFLCVYSDGLTEATNAELELFGNERLVEAFVAQGVELTATKKLDNVVEKISEFVGDSEPADDLTLMVMRWQPDQSA